MAQGRKQTEETKKKISEALKKPGSDQEGSSRPRSKVARKLFVEYQSSKQATLKFRAERDRLREIKRSLPRGKKSRGQRAKLKAQINVIRAKMKVEVQKRKVIRSSAKKARRVARAKIRIQKSRARIRKARKMEARARRLIAKVRGSKRKNKASRIQKLEARLKRIEKLRAKQNAIIETSRNTIKNKGVIAKRKIPKIFDFHELQENFTPSRVLTVQEQKVQFSELNDQFNKIKNELEDELIETTSQEINRFVKSSEEKIDNKDLTAIALLTLLITGKIKDSVGKAVKKSYNIGKSGASIETGVDRSPTPVFQTQLQNAEIEGIATAYTREIEKTAKSTIVDALAVGAVTAAIVSKVREKMTEVASKMIMNIKGTVVGQNVNRGRKQVFTENINKITKFQRSEILDRNTCNVCLSLDGRVVKADDPIAQMDLVHTNCGGVWVPIFVEEKQPVLNPIPSTVLKTFDLVDGRPIINSFKQLKKPINRASKDIQIIIKDKLRNPVKRTETRKVI